MKTVTLRLPLDRVTRYQLEPGDKVLLNGTIFTARDQAHARLTTMLERGEASPIPLNESALFYCGPAPTPPGMVSGAIGPTTSARMDRFTRLLLRHGLRVMIGKGDRSPEIEASIRQHEGIYLVCPGGCSALLTQSVVSRETYLWPELGAEAVYRLAVHDLPCYVAII